MNRIGKVIHFQQRKYLFGFIRIQYAIEDCKRDLNSNTIRRLAKMDRNLDKFRDISIRYIHYIRFQLGWKQIIWTFQTSVLSKDV